MDKYDGINKPSTVSYNIEYATINKASLQKEPKKTKASAAIKSKNKSSAYFYFRAIVCFLLLVFPLAARFTELEIAQTINNFLINELTREINIPFINANAQTKIYCYYYH